MTKSRRALPYKTQPERAIIAEDIDPAKRQSAHPTDPPAPQRRKAEFLPYDDTTHPRSGSYMRHGARRRRTGATLRPKTPPDTGGHENRGSTAIYQDTPPSRPQSTHPPDPTTPERVFAVGQHAQPVIGKQETHRGVPCSTDHPDRTSGLFSQFSMPPNTKHLLHPALPADHAPLLGFVRAVPTDRAWAVLARQHNLTEHPAQEFASLELLAVEIRQESSQFLCPGGLNPDAIDFATGKPSIPRIECRVPTIEDDIVTPDGVTVRPAVLSVSNDDHHSLPRQPSEPSWCTCRIRRQHRFCRSDSFSDC